MLQAMFKLRLVVSTMLHHLSTIMCGTCLFSAITSLNSDGNCDEHRGKAISESDHDEIVDDSNNSR